MVRPFIPIDKCIRVELIYKNGPLVAENVIYFDCSFAPAVTDLPALASTIITEWSNNLRAKISNNWSLTSVKITSMQSAIAPMLEYTTGLPLAGSNNTPAAPPNVTICISFKTGMSGRSARGRVYHIGIGANVVSHQGAVTPATADLIRTGWANFITAVVWSGTSPELIHCVASFRTNKQWRDQGVKYEVTSYTLADYNADSMRRRLPGRGRT